MKIDPNGKYDREVYKFLDKIEYQRKQNGSDIVYISDRYKPQNERFYDTQFLIDKLNRQNILSVLDVSQVELGESGNYKAIQFKLKVLNPKFNMIYSTYRNIFEISKENSILIDKNGEVVFYCEGGKYTALFKPRSNNYCVLMFMAQRSQQPATIDEINEVMARSKRDSSPDSKERVQDVIKNIKRKLEYKGKKLFKSNYDSFTLLPKTVIKT